MNIPFVPDPTRYVGLCLYDFGTHVSLGYTAGEIEMLRSHESHAGGQAYEIYRVNENGGFELRGVSGRAEEALCFLYDDGAAARGRYQWLCEKAAEEPVDCEVRVHLARLDDFKPPEVVALAYRSVVSSVVAAWLDRVGFAEADCVIAGADAYETVRQGRGARKASGFLASRWNHRDRSVAELLSAVDLAVQR